MLKLNTIAAALVAAALFFSSACSPQAKHPNQINDFDGATYDSLTVAHAALTTLRATISTSYPQYKPAFNQAATAYQLAFTSYSSFRVSVSMQPQAAIAISSLTVSIVNLENAFQADMHVQPAKANAIRQRTYQLRAANPTISISDILTELQIAATVAAGVPVAAPYAALAELVISTARIAIDSMTAASGQPIDLTTIAPIALIA